MKTLRGRPSVTVVKRHDTTTSDADERAEVWIRIAPTPMRWRRGRLLLCRCARALSRVGSNGTAATTIAAVRADAVARSRKLSPGLAAGVTVSANVLCDLRAQGWTFRVARGAIFALAPLSIGRSVEEDKNRVRIAHLVERDAQLSQRSVVRFIKDMERRRLHEGQWHSIFSLVRDGRELADSLRRASLRSQGRERASALRGAIAPYVQVVEPGSVCQFTGLNLMSIWRYFRHTWTTTYQSTPGRKLFFLVRDRARPNHPVVGIGALGSAIVQLSVRDAWIGWATPQFLAALRERPSAAWARWIRESLKALIGGIMFGDFVREHLCRRKDLTSPTAALVERLRAFAETERARHRRYPAHQQHKQAGSASSDRAEDWKGQATTHLFRSKRAAALAELLEARRRLQRVGFTEGSAAQLQRALDTPDATRAIHTILRHSKAAHVGVDMMDITVCGAIAPYNEVLGGKLVSLLMASPDVIGAYNRRYRRASSLIASSMAGRPVCRTPHLVLLSTTSLYGAGASQYNRIRMPASSAGGVAAGSLEYLALGRTVGYGSFHFSQETMAALDVVLRRLSRGRPVNSIFGEGVNPKLRKVRSAFDVVGLPSDLLLQHGSPRLVYGVALASNFRDVLLGRARRPRYILPQTAESTACIVQYWRDRWLNKRIENPAVLVAVERHSLAYPLQHGARVTLSVLQETMG